MAAWTADWRAHLAGVTDDLRSSSGNSMVRPAFTAVPETLTFIALRAGSCIDDEHEFGM